MATRYIVQAHEEGEWKTVYQGEDPTKVQSTYHEARIYVGDDNVRALKSTGTNDEGKTQWAAVLVPAPPKQQGLYNGLVDGLHGFWTRRGHAVSRSEVKFFWMPFFIVITVVLPLLLVVALLFGSASPNGINPDYDGTSVEAANQYQEPIQQARLDRLVDEYRAQYQSAQNDIQRRQARENRAAAIGNLFAAGYEIRDWSASLDTLYTHGDGNVGFVKLRVGNGIIFTHQTTIEQSDPLYQKLARIPEDAKVVFSGRLMPGREDYLREASLTERGSMNEPEFAVKLTDIYLQSEWRPSAGSSNSYINVWTEIAPKKDQATTGSQAIPSAGPSPDIAFIEGYWASNCAIAMGSVNPGNYHKWTARLYKWDSSLHAFHVTETGQVFGVDIEPSQFISTFEMQGNQLIETEIRNDSGGLQIKTFYDFTGQNIDKDYSETGNESQLPMLSAVRWQDNKGHNVDGWSLPRMYRCRR